MVEPDREAFIDHLEIIEACLADFFPELDGFRISLLLAAKPVAGLVSQLRVFLFFLVVPDVEGVEGVEVFEIFFLAPVLQPTNHFSELRAPVAQVVDADALVAEAGKDPVEGAADDGRAQVPDVKGLGNIG